MTERQSSWLKWTLEIAAIFIGVGIFVATTQSDINRLHASVTDIDRRVSVIELWRAEDSQVIRALGKIRCLESPRNLTQMAGLPCDRLLGGSP